MLSNFHFVPKILVVDDEPDIIELLEYNLSKEGYRVRTASNGRQAIQTVQSFMPDLILLDLMLPETDGMQVGRQVRQMPACGQTKIVFLTARQEEYAEIAAFEAGADDYLVKPVKVRALLSRIKSLLTHRAGSLQATEITANELVIHRIRYNVTYRGRLIELPRKEFELLCWLALQPDCIFTREQLLRHVWGENIYVTLRTIDVHIRKIREKIPHDYIRTIKGVGYQFVLNKEGAPEVQR